MGINEQRGSSQEMWRSSDSNRAQTSGIRTTSGVFPNDLEGTDKLSPAQGKQQGQGTKRMQKKVSHRLQPTRPTPDLSQEIREYDDSQNNNWGLHSQYGSKPQPCRVQRTKAANVKNMMSKQDTETQA